QAGAPGVGRHRRRGSCLDLGAHGPIQNTRGAATALLPIEDRGWFGCNDEPAVHMRLNTPGVVLSRSLISFKEDLIRNVSHYGGVEDFGRPGGWRALVGRRRGVCR